MDQPGQPVAPPVMPQSMVSAYTLKGQIPVLQDYRDDTTGGNQTRIFTREKVDLCIKRANERGQSEYGMTDSWLYAALDQYPVSGKDVAIMGSTYPRYEGVCLAYGGRPTTIEYNPIQTEDPRLHTMTCAEYDAAPRTFQAAFSISSFEHDGLGRYGDPLNPNGDLATMQRMKSIVETGGLLFLAVPVAEDAVVWNAHRIYGPIRLPMLLAGWRVLDIFDLDTCVRLLHRREHERSAPQPVFVLENAAGKGLDLDRLCRQARRWHLKKDATDRVKRLIWRLRLSLKGQSDA
jgi:hypothetical protein